MLRKLLTYEEAKARQWRYEDKIEQDKVYGLPKDWYGWGQTIKVKLLKEPYIKNMPVYVFRSYYLPAWLFEGETYKMFVPSFEVAKELEKRYEPESSKDSSTCLGVPISWEGWNSYRKWTEYDSFDNCYLIEGSWWMPYWLLCPHKTINFEVWK